MARPLSKTPTLYVNRRTRIYFRFMEEKDGTEAAKDISAAALAVYLRGYTRPPTDESAYLWNATGTKTLNPDGSESGTAGSTGWAYFDIQPAAAAADLGEVFCELVVADTADAVSPSSLTPSGYREYVWGEERTVRVVDTADGT